ncbi:MAG: hypothetical protein OEX81_01615 [Candidatus Pacebacteria bacterium]|nr:hypothetical protein [Candidatus Paceibacterota bacterium]
MNLNPFHKTQLEKIEGSLINVVKNKEARHHALSVISIIFLFVSIFVGIFVGLLQSQEVRKQASEDYRKAEIILVPSTTPLRAETLSTVFVRLDTNGESIDGIQVVFDLLTDVTDEVTINVKEGQGLRWAWDKVESIEGGHKVSFAAITNDPYKPFSSNSPIDVAEITFTAKKSGNLAMVFDGFFTKVNKHQQLRNILKPIIIQEYQIATAPTPTPTPRIVTQPKGGFVQVSPTPVITKGEEKEATDSVIAQVVITTDDAACNESCQSSSECGKNLLCYEGSCRLATNLTSLKCEDISQRSKSCNQDCSQAIECKIGLSCFEGKCRVTSNPQSSVCQSDQTITNTIENLCSKECTTNSDCGDTLSCSTGVCRLATNPSSPNCSAKEVVVRNLGSDKEVTTKTPVVTTSEDSLSLLTQVLIALALTVGIGFAGVIAYSFIRNKRNHQEL